MDSRPKTNNTLKLHIHMIHSLNILNNTLPNVTIGYNSSIFNLSDNKFNKFKNENQNLLTIRKRTNNTAPTIHTSMGILQEMLPTHRSAHFDANLNNHLLSVISANTAPRKDNNREYSTHGKKENERKYIIPVTQRTGDFWKISTPEKPKSAKRPTPQHKKNPEKGTPSLRELEPKCLSTLKWWLNNASRKTQRTQTKKNNLIKTKRRSST